MRIVISGATGFIGKELARELVTAGYEVFALSRNPRTALPSERFQIIGWDAKSAGEWKTYLEGALAIINLAGENISSGRWTKKRKQEILQSRLDAGKALVEATRQAKRKPKVLIQASAIGYYGSRREEEIDESFGPGAGYLPQVAQKWELSTKDVESMGVRHVIIRTGIVLGKEGGALPQLMKPYRFFLGGPPGSGKSWFSWIHLEDEVKAIRFLMENEYSNGVFNLTAPDPLPMKDFCRILGKVMHRPSWIGAPGFALRFFLGEMAQALLLSGQRVIPKRLLEAGFRFSYPDTESAVQQILKKV